MYTLRYYLWIAVFAVAFSGCSKNDTKENQLNDSVDFLTEQPWFLLSYGYDDNGNGEVDNKENNIKDCDRDNVYQFNKDGSGVVKENQIICDGHEQVSSFNWSLMDSDTIIDFYFAKAHIVELSGTRLCLTNTGDDSGKLMLIYGH